MASMHCFNCAPTGLIGFNPKFIIDALRVIDDETVTLYMVNPKAPCIIKNEEGSYLYLILPVNF